MKDFVKIKKMLVKASSPLVIGELYHVRFCEDVILCNSDSDINKVAPVIKKDSVFMLLSAPDNMLTCTLLCANKMYSTTITNLILIKNKYDT
jgi:hypothetical protein